MQSRHGYRNCGRSRNSSPVSSYICVLRNAAMTKKTSSSASKGAGQYKFPPIREAVIEIRVESALPVSVDSLKHAFDGEAGIPDEIHETQGEIILSPQMAASHHERK